MDCTPPIDSLPPELLDAVLASFPTPALLPLAAVSRRFHDLVAQLVHRRLRRAVALPSHQLILECYHPSAKISTPYLHCTYLGTDGLDRRSDAAAADDDDADATLERLPHMYSRFRPMPPDDGDVHVRNYRAIRRTMSFFMLSEAPVGTAGTSVPTASGKAAGGGEAGSADAAAAAAQPPLVSYDVYLDEGELFSQLCTVTNLVKTGPRQGLFLSCVNINDGVIRVWRDWLAGRTGGDGSSSNSGDGAHHGSHHGCAYSTRGVYSNIGHKGKTTAAADVPTIAPDAGENAVLWAYTGKHVGLRFRVTEKAVPDGPVLALANEELPVSYQLEYEELLVRTYELLLALEAAEVQEVSDSGTAIVIASL